MIYNKAIRDKIPEIIRASGSSCNVKALSDEKFLVELEKKLAEEVREYQKESDPSELADILEVVYRIADLRRISRDELEKIRIEKAQERGTFEKNLFLIETSNAENKRPRVEFSVDGKPPKKTKPSLWSVNSNQTQLVIDLRKKAYESAKDAGLEGHFHGPVKLTLHVYDPNPFERIDKHDYLGDLDALVGGIFESLQPAPPEVNNLEIHQKLKQIAEIRHDVALIVSDDAQISTTDAKKRKHEKSFYTVEIEEDNTCT